MDKAQFDRWLAAYGQAWEARDPEAAGALFSDDASYREVPFDAPIRGRAAIEAYWQDVPRSQKDISFRYEALAAGDALSIAHWQAEYTRVENGVRVALDGILTARFDERGQCSQFEEWWQRKEAA